MLSVTENPNISIRNMNRQLNISYGSVQRVLKKNKLRPYKMQTCQALSEPQKQLRLDFCQLMLNRIRNDHRFLNKIIWTDEATFCTSGISNRQNTRFWSNTNPEFLRPVKFQGRLSVNTWCGIHNGKILGPHFFDRTLRGEKYVNFLDTTFDIFFNEIPPNEQRSAIFQQDGAPPHNVRAATDYLNNKFMEWIGKSGTIRWPPNSPDLTPLDTFLWGYLKNKVYGNNLNNEDDIKNSVRDEINILNNNHNDFIQNATQNLLKRLRLCVEKQGGHFEHLL